uniref:O-antigen ligase family protein n=1 Tax=Pelagibacter ubique TaxID=198252 RepID=UPI000AFED2B3
IIFISLGIITSFSRTANFLLLLTILFYLIDNIFFSKNNSVSFKYLIIAIILFDIAIIGFYFGTSQIVDRFYFLKDEFASINYDKTILSRLVIAKFSLDEFKNFLFFGYGAGSYEYLFQLKFINPGNSFANHAHSDLVEFLGEFGVIGFFLISILVYKIFLQIFVFNIYNCILISYLVIILIFDFSFHVPLIQMLFIIFFSLNKKLFR